MKTVTLKDSSTVTLRRVLASDARSMLEHLVITHTESPRNMNSGPGAWENFPVEKEEEILRTFESDETKFMLVAVHEGRIVAGLGVTPAFGEYRKNNGTLGMSVQAAFSGLGLGTEMMRHALELAREIGYHRIELTVREFNLPAIALYEKLGFERYGTLKEVAFIDGAYFDEYAYQKIISASTA